MGIIPVWDDACIFSIHHMLGASLAARHGVCGPVKGPSRASFYWAEEEKQQQKKFGGGANHLCLKLGRDNMEGSAFLHHGKWPKGKLPDGGAGPFGCRSWGFLAPSGPQTISSYPEKYPLAQEGEVAAHGRMRRLG